MPKIHLSIEGSEAHLVFDNDNGKANIFDTDTLDELEQHINTLDQSSSVKQLFISSAKENIFIAGADIQQLKAISNKEEAIKAAQTGQRIFERLSKLKCFKIAMIHGACMGGGVELTLACDVRIASDSSKTKIALPEVKLGILPAWGGSTRLPKLLSFDKALDLLLTGKSLDGKRALKYGLVQACCPREKMLEVARKSKKPKKPFKAKLMGWGPLRNIALKKARQSVQKNTRGNYPAPLQILELLESSDSHNHLSSLESEATRLGTLAISPECKNLIQLFFNKEEADKNKSLQEECESLPKMESLGTLGAGIMGGGIAHLAAKQGYPVRMRDINNEGLGLGMNAAYDLVNKELKRRRIKKNDAMKRISRIVPVLNTKGFQHVDVAIEAIVENMEIKKKALAALEADMRPNSIIASNTSSLSITDMATALDRPQNFLGMHFFNPVDKMPLVEVIRGEKTSDTAVAAIVELTQKLGKTPVVVKDGPGFLVNRLLAPYMNEALRLVEEGYHPEYIDEVLLDYGMPMGPCHLIDEVGVDVADKVAHILEEGLGERMKGCALAGNMVQKNQLGRKSGIGFYKYLNKGQKESYELYENKKWEGDSQYILDRCLLPMWNEALRCLEEGVVDNQEKLDLAMILGTGYAPFRGGPFTAASTMGWKVVKEKLEKMVSEQGERYSPAPTIDQFID